MFVRLLVLTLIVGAAAPALAQDESAPPARLAAEFDQAQPGAEAAEFEDKQIFGFTTGTDVGTPGEREAEFETTLQVGKRGGGRYNAIEQEATYEKVESSRFAYELSLHGLSQQMKGVPGLDALSQTSFSGLSIEPKFILLRRGVDAPFGVAVSVKPEWDRIDPIVGAHASNYVLPLRLMADVELIREKLYAAVNLLYAPEWDDLNGAGFSQNAVFGLTGGLTARVTPKLALGGQVEFYSAYDSLGFSNAAGCGTFLGPTLMWEARDGAFVAATWSAQVAGRTDFSAPAGLVAYNRSELSRQRAKLTVGLQF